ncbi:MAG: hypothetical protein ABSG80_06750 [Verrucomicrobiota bacterium]|jgi:hypothetical protein
MTNATDNQLELGFNPDSRCRGANPARHGGRIARASWWFAHMRDIVERAMEATSEPRPEQIWIPGASRELKV